MTQIILPSRFVQPITDFYVNSYYRYISRFIRGRLWVDEHNRRYTRRMYLRNIRRVLSVNGKLLEKLDNSNGHLSTYTPWSTLGYHSFSYEHWYFAYDTPFIAPDGKTYVEIKDIIYEGEFHNDTMDEPVYLESKKRNKVIIKEFQLRQIIRETIREMLYRA